MASYKYKDIEKALLVTGFEEVKNNHGSHQAFVHKVTGILQTIPKHSNGEVAPGTAESILDFAIMQARIFKINICNSKYGLSKNVIDYAKKQHIKIKDNIINLIPEKIRIQRNITTQDDTFKFINDTALRAKDGKPTGTFA